MYLCVLCLDDSDDDREVSRKRTVRQAASKAVSKQREILLGDGGSEDEEHEDQEEPYMDRMYNGTVKHAFTKCYTQAINKLMPFRLVGNVQCVCVWTITNITWNWCLQIAKENELKALSACQFKRCFRVLLHYIQLSLFFLYSIAYLTSLGPWKSFRVNNLKEKVIIITGLDKMFWWAVRKLLQPQLCDIAIYTQLGIELCLPVSYNPTKYRWLWWMDGKMDKCFYMKLFHSTWCWNSSPPVCKVCNSKLYSQCCSTWRFLCGPFLCAADESGSDEDFMVEDDDDSDYGHSKKRGKKVIRRGRPDKKEKKSPKPRLKATGEKSYFLT